MHVINYTTSAGQEAVVGVPLSDASDSDKENLMKFTNSDSALKKHKQGITVLGDLNSKLDASKNTSGYETMEDSVTSTSCNFSEIENNVEMLNNNPEVFGAVAIQDLVKPSIFSPIANGTIQTVAAYVEIVCDPDPETSAAHQNGSNENLTEEDSNLAQVNLLHNVNYSGRSSSSLPPIIDPLLQTPSSSNAEANPIVETPKVKRKIREHLLAARFDSSASTHFGDDEIDSLDTETPSSSNSKGNPVVYVKDIRKIPEVTRGRGRPPKQNLNKKRKRAEESDGPTRSSKRIKLREEPQPIVEPPIKEPPRRIISKKQRYICPICNCELATRTIFKYHTGKCN